MNEKSSSEQELPIEELLLEELLRAEQARKENLSQELEEVEKEEAGEIESGDPNPGKEVEAPQESEDGIKNELELTTTEIALESCLGDKRQKLEELQLLQKNLAGGEKTLRGYEQQIAEKESYRAYIVAIISNGLDRHTEFLGQMREHRQKLIDFNLSIIEQIRLKKKEIKKTEKEVLAARRKMLLKINETSGERATVDGKIFTRESLVPVALENLKQKLRQEVVDEKITSSYEALSEEEKEEYENVDGYKKAIEDQCREINEEFEGFGITVTPEVFCKMVDEGYDLSDVDVRDSLINGSIKPIGVMVGSGLALGLAGGLGGLLVGAIGGYAGANADKLEIGAGYALDYTIGQFYEADFVKKMKQAEYTNTATNDWFKKQYNGIVVGGENGTVFSDRQFKKLVDEFAETVNENLDEAVEEKLIEKEQKAVTDAIKAAKEKGNVEAKEGILENLKIKWGKAGAEAEELIVVYLNGKITTKDFNDILGDKEQSPTIFIKDKAEREKFRRAVVERVKQQRDKRKNS